MTESVLNGKNNGGGKTGNELAVTAQPWLSSAPFDLGLIIGPAFIASLFVILFSGELASYDYLPLWAWIVFVLMVDVAHVYSTLFRTYLDPVAFSKNSTLLVSIPILTWAVGALLYSMGDMVFWRCLAYLAVFHFIRQQYGFVSLYSRKEPALFRNSGLRMLDGLFIYLATLYPIIYWHTHMPRNFNWFIAGDFIKGIPDILANSALAIYIVVAVAYLVKEVVLYTKTGYLNIPRNLIICGTAVSWWVGIVALNSDMAFTITNVVSHGIPYIALIWLYHNRRGTTGDAGEVSVNRYFSLFRNLLVTYLPAFLVFLFILAYLEEGLWDGFVWREHGAIFGFFHALPVLKDSVMLSILVPLLSLPQATHYVLDGFIWRIKDKDSIWST